MIKFKLAALLAGLIFPGLLLAQYSDFDLSKYRLPDIKTSRLDLNFNLNQNGFTNSYDTSESRFSTFSSALDLNYYRFRNSERYQGMININADFSPESSKTSTIENRTTRNINADIAINSTNILFNQDMNFIEISPFISHYSSDSRYRYRSTSYSREENDASFATTFSVPISVGHGRIEPVEDARLAIYILEELTKAGRIYGRPSDDVIIAMAREISKIKRKRFFDTRIRKIEELHAIDSFLVANRIISESDISYFAVLNDQWDYASGPQRQAGFAVSAGLNDRMSFYKSYRKVIDEIPVHDNGGSYVYVIGGFVKMRYEKPVNLHWQASGSVTGSYNAEFTTDPLKKDNIEGNFTTHILRTDFNCSILFVPDSRTSFRLGMYGSYSASQGKHTLGGTGSPAFDLKSSLVALYPALDVYYYVSPRLRIQLNSSLDLYNTRTTRKFEAIYADEKDTWDRFEHDVSVSLVYSFF